MARISVENNQALILPHPSGDSTHPNTGAYRRLRRYADQLHASGYTFQPLTPIDPPEADITSVEPTQYGNYEDPTAARRGASGTLGTSIHLRTVNSFNPIVHRGQPLPDYRQSRPGIVHFENNPDSATAIQELSVRTAATMAREVSEIVDPKQVAFELNLLNTQLRKWYGIDTVDTAIQRAARSTPSYKEGDILTDYDDPRALAGNQTFATRALQEYLAGGGTRTDYLQMLDELKNAKELRSFFPGYHILPGARDVDLKGAPYANTLVVDNVRPDGISIGLNKNFLENADPDQTAVQDMFRANEILKSRGVFGVMDTTDLSLEDLMVLQRVVRRIGHEYAWNVFEMKLNTTGQAPEQVMSYYRTAFMGACGSVLVNGQMLTGSKLRPSEYIDQVVKNGGLNPHLLVVTAPVFESKRHPFTTPADLINNIESTGFDFNLSETFPLDELATMAVTGLANRISRGLDHQKELISRRIMDKIVNRMVPTPQDEDPITIRQLLSRFDAAYSYLRGLPFLDLKKLAATRNLSLSDLEVMATEPEYCQVEE